MPGKTYLDTRQLNFKVALAANSTSTASLAVTAATTTKPVSTTAIAVIPVEGNQTVLRFFGRDTDNDDIQILISLIAGSARGGSPVYTYEPVIILDTYMSTYVGIAGEAVTNSDRWMDTLTANGNYSTTLAPEIYSPSADGPLANCPGHIIINHLQYSAIEVQGDLNGVGTTAGTEWNVEAAPLY